jgi:hypothetical protein
MKKEVKWNDKKKAQEEELYTKKKAKENEKVRIVRRRA